MTSLEEPKLDGANDIHDIHDIVIECKRLFESLAERVKLDHGEKDIKTEKGEQEDGQTAFGDRIGSSNLSTDEMKSRSHLWIDGSGALAADVSRSLDTRLPARRYIKKMVTDQLQVLARNLKYRKSTSAKQLHTYISICCFYCFYCFCVALTTNFQFTKATVPIRMFQAAVAATTVTRMSWKTKPGVRSGVL